MLPCSQIIKKSTLECDGGGNKRREKKDNCDGNFTCSKRGKRTNIKNNYGSRRKAREKGM